MLWVTRRETQVRRRGRLAPDQLEPEKNQDRAAQSAAEEQVEQRPTSSKYGWSGDNGFGKHDRLLRL